MNIIGKSGSLILVTMSEHEAECISGISTYKNEEFRTAVREGKSYEFDPLAVLERVTDVTKVPTELRKLKTQVSQISEYIDKALESVKQNDFLAFGKPKEEGLIK